MAFSESRKKAGSESGINRLIRAKRISIDRRFDTEDRRAVYSIDYFAGDNNERRRGANERRHNLFERRNGWIRVTQWNSVYVG